MPLFYARRCSDSDTAPGQPADACTRTRTHIYFTRRAGPLQLQLQRQMHRGCLPGLVCLGLLPCLPARLCVVRLGLAARIQTAKLTLCDEAIDTRHEAQPSPWPASCAARRDITMYPSIHVCMYVYLACIAIGPAVRGIDSRHVPILPPAPRTTRGHCMVPTATRNGLRRGTLVESGWCRMVRDQLPGLSRCRRPVRRALRTAASPPFVLAISVSSPHCTHVDCARGCHQLLFDQLTHRCHTPPALTLPYLARSPSSSCAISGHAMPCIKLQEHQK